MRSLMPIALAAAALSAGASITIPGAEPSRRRRELYPDGMACSVTKEGFVVRWSTEKDNYVVTDEKFVDLDIEQLSEREMRLLDSAIDRLDRQEKARVHAEKKEAYARYRIDAYNQGIDPTNQQPLSRQQRRQIARKGIPVR
jgi:hypothetical protein